jgi:hypothetical protein
MVLVPMPLFRGGISPWGRDLPEDYFPQTMSNWVTVLNDAWN